MGLDLHFLVPALWLVRSLLSQQSIATIMVFPLKLNSSKTREA